MQGYDIGIVRPRYTSHQSSECGSSDSPAHHLDFVSLHSIATIVILQKGEGETNNIFESLNFLDVSYITFEGVAGFGEMGGVSQLL